MPRPAPTLRAVLLRLDADRQEHSADAASSAAWTSWSAPAIASAWSGRTAPARPRCCGSPRARTTPDEGRVSPRAACAWDCCARRSTRARRARVREEASLATQHLDALEQEIARLEREMAALGARGAELPEELARALRPRARGVRVRGRLRARGARRARARGARLRRERARPPARVVLRRLAHARRAREAAARRARRAAARRADQPPRPAVDPVVRGDARRVSAAARS